MKELCSLELEAAQNGDTAEAEKHRNMQKLFFKEHLGRWGGALGREMIKMAKTDFYRAVGYVLEDFIDEEKEALA